MANENVSNIPSFEEYYRQKTGQDAPLLHHVASTEARIPTWEEYATAKGLQPFAINPQQETVEQQGEFSKGFSRGWRQTLALGHGALGAIADHAGAFDFAQRRIDDYTALMHEAEQFSADVGSIEEIDSPGKFVSWAASTLGEQVPNIASILLSGGVGGLVAKVAAKQAVKGALKETTEEAIQQQLMQKVAQWTTRGALGGTYLGASALETGGIFGEQVEAGLEPRGGVALAGGGAAGALEIIPFVTVARRLGFGNAAKSAILNEINALNLPKRILATSALVAGQEAGTEALQEAIAIGARKFVDENYDALGPEARSRILNSAAAGALLGGIFGVPAGVRQHAGQTTDPDEYAPHVQAINEPAPVEPGIAPEAATVAPVTSAVREGIKAQADSYVPTWLESPKTPFAETYLLDDNGLRQKESTNPADIIVNAEGMTNSNWKSELENLVARIKQEEQTSKSIHIPQTKATPEFNGIYLGQEVKFNKTVTMLQQALDKALMDYGVDLGTATSDSYIRAYPGRAKRIRALDKALRAAKEKQYTELAGQFTPADTASTGLTGLEAKTPIPAEVPPSEVVITPDQAVPLDLTKLSPAQRNRVNQLLQKEQFDGLNEREYATLEKLLARAEGEKVAERMQSNKQQEAKELEALINETHKSETVRSQLAEAAEKTLAKPIVGTTPEEIFNAVREVLTKLKLENLPKVKIVNSLDLYNTDIANEASTSRGIYQLTRGGQSIVYLIEDNIPSAQAAVRTLMHELFGHYGLRAFLTPEQKQKFLQLVAKHIDLTDLATRYERMRGTLTDRQFNYLVAEEYVAKVAEDGTNMPLLNRIIAWIKANLRKWFPKWSEKNVSFTDEDIRYMLRDIHLFLRGRLNPKNPDGAGIHVGRTGEIYSAEFAAQTDSVLSQLDFAEEELKAVAHDVNNLGNAWGVKFAKLFLTPLQIAERYKLPQIKQYVDAVQRFWAAKAGIISEADGVVTDWRTLGKESAQKVAKALFEISEESDIKEQRIPEAAVLEMLQKKYKLSQEEIEQYVQVDRSLRDLLDRLEKGVKLNAVKESLPNVNPIEFLEQWESTFMFKDRQELVEKYSPGGVADLTILQRLLEIQEQFDLMRNRNYFPRMRFGQYTVAVRAKSSGVVNGQDVDAGELVHFEAFESQAARAIGLLEIEKEFANDDVFIRESKLSDQAFTFMGLPPALRDTLKTQLDLTPEQQELLTDVFVKMSPGRSFMKHLRKRRGVQGYSEDAMRVFASYMMSAANHLARIEHFTDMQKPIADMKALETTRNPYIPNTTSLVELREYFEEHLDYLLNPKNDWAKLRAMGFLWYLGLNPKSAMVNATQVPMVTYPYLASKFGDGAAMAAIVDSYKRVSKTLRGRGPGVLTTDEMQLFARLLEEGVLDESQVMELAGIAEAPSLFRIIPEQTSTRLINKASYFAGWMFRNVEKFNRRVAALSAFKLAKDNGMNTEEAYQAAKTAVQTTQYEYAKWNRPKFMRGRRSVIFLFWQYLQHTSYLMAGGAGKQTAMRMWLMMLTMSGMLGLPFAEDMLDLIDWGGTKVKDLTGLKNPRVDTRLAIRELLTSITDSPDIFLHGLGRYYGLGPMHVLEALGIPVPNVDVSGSLSLGRIVPGLEQGMGDTRNPNEKFGRVLVDVLGPVGAIGFNLWKALESSDPDTWKKWERAMPIALKSASRSVRWMARGEETASTGAQILNFDPYDYEQQAEKVAQFFGFTPTRMNQKYGMVMAQEEAKQYWMARRSILLSHYGYAMLTHDQQGISDVRAAVRDFNRTAPDNKLRITGKDIALSIKQRKRIKRLTEQGVPAQKRYRQLAGEVAELFPENK